MAKKPSLLDDVLGCISNAKPGPPTWFDRLPPEAQQEMLRVRESYMPLAYQKRAYYRATQAAAEKRGWQIPGEKQFLAWLTAR